MRRPELAALLALWLAAACGLQLLTTRVADWFVMTDELLYERRSEEHTSELQSQSNLVCRLLLEKKKDAACPIQQGLADGNPDVDAIYRITLSLPQTFRRDISVALGPGSWCPFNSQNTAWWPDAYPLLYLPAHCSFRVTDIWRSFVAQRISWANDWHILFHGPDVTQERNPHNLLRDFADEIPGYLQNRAICEALAQLELPRGTTHIADNLRTCYQALVIGGWLPDAELKLLEDWL